MTTLKLDTLSDRIKAHKNALVHIVKPPQTMPETGHAQRSHSAQKMRWCIL